MLEAVISFLLDIVFYWIGVGVLKVITLGGYRRHKSHNEFMISLLGLFVSVVIVALAIFFIRK